ncbi:sterol desaturase family protein, partial [Tenacibaculum sp.]|nr:sterol desaturase family protein [Tenacibaculum sp.]
EVDISTTVREHPGETFVRVSYLVAVVFILGVPAEFLLLKQFIQSFVNLTSHSKIKLPKKVNDIISLVIVTPNTHHVHHHYVLPHTDSNYGDILTVWDRLFKTFSNLNQSDIVHGIDTNMDVLENKDFKNLITRPFDDNRVHTTNPKPSKLPNLKIIKQQG